MILDAAPVAAVEGAVADQVDGAGHVLPLALRHHQQDALGHALADEREEAAVEVGPAPFARAGIDVEPVERVPVGFGQIGAGDPLDGEPGRQRVAPLALDRLALARGQRAEEIVEGGVARIVPVELLVDAAQEAEVARPLGLRLRQEGGVDRRGLDLLAQGPQAGDEGGGGLVRVLARGDQEARAGDRRERHADLELRVVAAAGALEGVGPAVIEHVLALRMGLQVAGGIADHPAVALGGDVQRQPAGAAADASRILQRRQEGVADEGVVALGCARKRLGREGAAVPLGRRDLGDALDDADLQGARLRGGAAPCFAGLFHGVRS